MKLDLEGHLKELQEFTDTDAFDRIETWYRSDPEARKDATGWEKPPHEKTGDRAAALVRFGIDDLPSQYPERRSFEYPPISETGDILFSVGTETLLTGIAMKVNTDWFLDYCNQRDRTPSFGKVIDDKVPEWIAKLSDEQSQRVLTVLRTLKARRNNLVHFGLHQMRHLPDYPAHYDVIAYFFAEFFDEEADVVGLLREKAAQSSSQRVNVDYQWLYFQFED